MYEGRRKKRKGGKGERKKGEGVFICLLMTVLEYDGLFFEKLKHIVKQRHRRPLPRRTRGGGGEKSYPNFTPVELLDLT